MTSLALAMQDAGWTVSGSDVSDEFITDPVLASRHIPIQPLSAPIPPADQVIYSTAYPAPSSIAIPLAQALADFVKDRVVIAVAGVGGKTTTTAMLASLFHAAGRDVGYYVGTSSIAGLSAPGHCGTDPVYIVEADEYAISKTDPRPKFALLTPQVVITTNIVHDHPDIYPNEGSTLAAFRELIERLPADGAWIYSSTDPLSQNLCKGSTLVCQTIHYALPDPPLTLNVFGEQNQLDAQAAVLAATAAGLTHEEALRSIQSYRGAGRRQEFHGEVAGRLLYDDYGHHPGELKLTIQAFIDHFPARRLLVVFESHTYSRTEALLAGFAEALKLADMAFIMPIFESAREKGLPHTVTPESFASLIPGAIPLTWDSAADTIWSTSQPGDIILTMGAGFVYKLHEKFKLKL